MSLALLFYLSLESLSALVSLVPFISETPYMLVFQCLSAWKRAAVAYVIVLHFVEVGLLMTWKVLLQGFI